MFWIMDMYCLNLAFSFVKRFTVRDAFEISIQHFTRGVDEDPQHLE